MKKKILTCAIVGFLYIVNANAQVGIGTTTPNSTLDVRGSISLGYKAFTANTSAAISDNTLVFTGTSAATLTLPDATLCTGRAYWVKSTSSNSSVLTIATTASQTVEGLASWTVTQTNKVIRLTSDGANWLIVAESLPGNSAGTAWLNGGNNVSSTQNIGTTSNFDLPFYTNNTEKMRLTASGNLGIGTITFNVLNPEKFLVDAGATGNTNFQNVVVGKGNTNSYAQLNIQNSNAGTGASSDVVATADNGNETINYIDMGINSSANTSGFFGGADDAYLYTQGQNLLVGTATSGKSLVFLTGGTSQGSNERMRITGTGSVGVGTTNPNSKLDVSGSAGFAITTTNSDITLDNANYTVILTSSNPIVTLPSASSVNRRVYVIVNQTNAARTISAYKDFAAASSTSIPANSAITIQSNGTNWYRIQ
jgi:hypothetical protein